MKSSKFKSTRVTTNLKVSIYAMAIISSILIASCKKDTTETPTATTITSDDAADIVASSIGIASSGSTSSISDGAQKAFFASTLPTPCIFGLDTTYTKSNTPGSYATYNYNLHYTYQMYCISSVPTSLIFNLTTNGNLDLPRLFTSTNASGVLTLTGLLPSNSTYIANGTYTRKGSAISKVRAKNSFSYQLNLNLSNVSIAKTTYAVQAGTCDVTIIATTSTGKIVSFKGLLTYLNATTASLEIGGKTYTINLPKSEAN